MAGKKLVKKTLPAVEAQNEVLATIVADAIQAGTPITLHVTRNDIIFEFLPGKIGLDLLKGKISLKDTVYAKTQGGKRLGLLDVLIGNTGRTQASWMLYEGKIMGFDHRLAFLWEKQAGKGKIGGFGLQWVQTDRHGNIKRYKGLLAPEDVPVLRRRLRATRRAFQALNRDRDWVKMMEVFEQIAKLAKSSKRLIGDD